MQTRGLHQQQQLLRSLLYITDWLADATKVETTLGDFCSSSFTPPLISPIIVCLIASQQWPSSLSQLFSLLVPFNWLFNCLPACLLWWWWPAPRSFFHCLSIRPFLSILAVRLLWSHLTDFDYYFLSLLELWLSFCSFFSLFLKLCCCSLLLSTMFLTLRLSFLWFSKKIVLQKENWTMQVCILDLTF